MKSMLLTVSCVLWLLSSGPALAQQDPDDPGIQDSVIIGSASVDSSGQFRFVSVPIYAVTDDSVAFLNMPTGWQALAGGVTAFHVAYYWPLSCWEDMTFDTIMTNENYVRIMGWTPRPECYLSTDSIRLHIINLWFAISPNTPSQLVVIDTVWDQLNGSILFGLVGGITDITPAVQRGFIAIGPGVGIDDENPIPQIFSLSQNYPNPFNSSTTIEFGLKIAGRVSLSIFDVRGALVETLVDKKLPSGNHSVVWNADNLSSGTYYYSLKTVEGTKTRKMTLMK